MFSVVFNETMSVSAMRRRLPCCQQFFKRHAHVLFLFLLLLLSGQSVALADLSTLKSGSQITQQPQDRRTPTQVQLGYNKMFPYSDAHDQLDNPRSPMTIQPPGPGGSAGGGSGNGVNTSSAGGGSGGGGSGSGQNKWTKQTEGTPQYYLTRVPVVGGPPYNQPKTDVMWPVPTLPDRIMFYKPPPFDYMPTTLAEKQLYMQIMTVMESDLKNSPSRRMYQISSTFESAHIAAADAIAKGNTIAYTNAFQGIVSGLGSGGGGAGGGGGGGGSSGALINVANEAAGVPTTGSASQKTIPQAVWMVQQMYRYVFTPLAILFLLPGAVITQAKALVTANMNLRADDASSPFEGILRSIVAIFLIPCTQLIVSYSIDVGNSMAYEVSNWVDLQSILDWANKLSYNPANYDNMVLPPQQASSSGGSGSGGGGSSTASVGGTNWAGLAASGNWSALSQAALSTLGGSGSGGNQAAGDGEEPNEDENQAVNERQAWDSTSLQTMFNGTMDIFSLALMVMTAFQLVYMCYLYLMGPLSAAFFAWPTVQGKLFRTVFGNWMNAVIMLALWRFYWMVILAIMTQRLIYVGETGGQFDLQWEVAVFTCLLGLMFYVPMNPWNFDPGNAYQASTQMGQGLMNGGGGGGDGGGGGGGENDAASSPLAHAASPSEDNHQPSSDRQRQPSEHSDATPPPTLVSNDTGGDDYGDTDYVAAVDYPDGGSIDGDVGDRQLALAEPAPQPEQNGEELPPGDSGKLLTAALDAGDTPFDLTPQGGNEIGFQPNENVDGQQVAVALASQDFAPLTQGQQLDSPPTSSGSSSGQGDLTIPSAPVSGVSVAMNEPPTTPQDSGDSSAHQDLQHHGSHEEGSGRVQV